VAAELRLLLSSGTLHDLCPCVVIATGTENTFDLFTRAIPGVGDNLRKIYGVNRAGHALCEPPASEFREKPLLESPYVPGLLRICLGRHVRLVL
jgi:hypothetical protein